MGRLEFEQVEAQEPSVKEESWPVRGGDCVTLRAAQAADGAAVQQMVDGLSGESRYFRFLTGGRVVDEIVEGLVAPGQGGVALVVTARLGDRQAIIANGQYVVTGDRVAEFAVVVADAWQGQGLGRRLIHKLQQLARQAGLRLMRGDVLSENRRMLAILRDCGFSSRRNPEDSFLSEVTMPLAQSGAGQPRLPADWFSAR